MSKQSKPNLPRQMPALLPGNFADLLLEYRLAAQRTQDAAAAAAEAERVKQVLYEQQSALRDKIILTWKAHRSTCIHSELFRLPDNDMVELQGNSICFLKPTNLC